jgi:biopolymer transport protein ExbD
MAARGPSDADGGCFADINVTPLVDVTLVLLIIFMVAAPMIVATPSIKVQLPKAASAEETEKSTLALALEKQEGDKFRLLVNGDESDEQSVRALIPKLLEKDQELQAVIAADKGLPYGAVMHLVDLVKSAGVHKFALNTDPTPE